LDGALPLLNGRIGLLPASGQGEEEKRNGSHPKNVRHAANDRNGSNPVMAALGGKLPLAR
jgi:hypothetical protein